MTSCVSILLAAGSSSRLGRPKQLLKIDGETLLHRSARVAAEAGCGENLVVLGAFAEQLAPELADLDSRVIINQDWRQGMGTSIATAMRTIQLMSPTPQAVLLLVCDQPALEAATLRRLIAENDVSKKGITASRYAGVAGVPMVFREKYFPALASLSGEQGARRLLSLHPTDFACVDFPKGSIDVDTEADAEKLTGYRVNIKE